MQRALKLNCHMSALSYLPVGRVKHDYMPALRGLHCIFRNIDLENAEEFSDDFWERMKLTNTKCGSDDFLWNSRVVNLGCAGPPTHRDFISIFSFHI